MKSVNVTQFKNISILVIGAVVIASASYFAGTKKTNENDDQLPSLAMETSDHVRALQTAFVVLSKELNVSPKAMDEMNAIYKSVPPTNADFEKHFSEGSQLPSLAMETSSHVMALQTALLVVAKDLKVSPKAMEEMVALYTSVPPTRRDFAKHFEGKK